MAFTFSLDCGRDIHNPQEIEDIFGKAVRDIVDEVKNQSRTSAISNLVLLTQKDFRFLAPNAKRF